MIPWEKLDAARVPHGAGELRLMRRGREYSIMLGAIELMSSRLSGSEEALATLVCERLAGRAAPAFLIGGLGMGFTLRAALRALGPDATLVVAELVPQVVAWARGPMADLFAGCLDDPRVRIVTGDVKDVIAAERRRYDAILLDVDNGPEGLTLAGNDRLYAASGLAAARAALKTGGVLAVWSSSPDRAFKRRLENAGFAVDERRVRASTRGGGARHVVWLGEKRETAR